MNKVELAARVAQRSGQPPEKTAHVVGLLFRVIAETLGRGEEVRVAGFGSFRRRYLPARYVRNPRTGELQPVAPRFVPTFVASDRLRRAVLPQDRIEGLRPEQSVSGLTMQVTEDAARTTAEQPGSAGEQLSRRVGVHLYLPECVVVGELFVSEPSLAGFLQVSGTCLYLHNAVAFPYLEGSPPTRTKEVAVRKDDVLFIVARGELANEPPSAAVTEVQAMCGAFAIRGKSSLPWATLIRELSQEEQRFIPLWQVTVHGPSRASFSEPSILLGLRRLTLLGT